VSIVSLTGAGLDNALLTAFLKLSSSLAFKSNSFAKVLQSKGASSELVSVALSGTESQSSSSSC